MSIGPQEQAAAVERAAMNLNGHVNHLSDLVEKGKRPAAELAEARRWLPGLQAAAVTIRKLAQAAPKPISRDLKRSLTAGLE